MTRRGRTRQPRRVAFHPTSLAAAVAALAFATVAAATEPPASDTRDWRAAMARIFAAAEETYGGLDAPEWEVEPTEQELRQAQPPLGLTGLVRMICIATEAGWLERCTVREAWPGGLGYDAAALKLAGRYRLSARQLGQGAAGEPVTVRILFPVRASAAESSARPGVSIRKP